MPGQVDLGAQPARLLPWGLGGVAVGLVGLPGLAGAAFFLLDVVSPLAIPIALFSLLGLSIVVARLRSKPLLIVWVGSAWFGCTGFVVWSAIRLASLTLEADAIGYGLIILGIALMVVTSTAVALLVGYFAMNVKTASQ